MNESDLAGFTTLQLKAIRNDLLYLKKSLSSHDQKLLDQLAGFSMLPPSRLIDAYRSARQAAKRHSNAAIVEFGVYRGGALAAMAYGASLTDCFTGSVIGFDTFEGHTIPPLSHEVDLHGNLQQPIFYQKQSKSEAWADCDLDTVIHNFGSIAKGIQTTLPGPVLIKGDACDTASQLTRLCPNGISLLRLDMDWYEPTQAALNAALPLLRSNAILIVDDYGHHSGVKDAIDAFLSNLKIPFDSTFTDYSCQRIVLLA
jgi:O-methyltransferase